MYQPATQLQKTLLNIIYNTHAKITAQSCDIPIITELELIAEDLKKIPNFFNMQSWIRYYIQKPLWKQKKELVVLGTQLLIILSDNPCSEDQKKYDIRGNFIAYTLSESVWAKRMTSALQREISLVSKVTQRFSIELPTEDLSIESCYQAYQEIKNDFEKKLEAYMMNEFPKLTTAECSVIREAKNCEALFKKSLTLLFEYMRGHFFFLERGRLGLEKSEIQHRRDSVENLHAGIAATETLKRAQTLQNLFSSESFHAKTIHARSGSSVEGFDEFCRKRNIPFICGASGSLTYLLAAHFSLGNLTKQELEKIVLFHAARMIYYGQHSLCEVIVVAQSLYLFDQIEQIDHSDEDPNFYDKFTRSFANYIEKEHQLPGEILTDTHRINGLFYNRVTEV